MVEQVTVSKNQLISELIRIGHGKFDIFKDVGVRAAQKEPELFAHFISWNQKKGEVLDSKIAFPICALRGQFDQDYTENAVANLCALDPRSFIRAVGFHQLMNKNGHPVKDGQGTALKKGAKLYLQARQRGYLAERSMLQHRASMKNLFKMFRVKPSKYVQDILFDCNYPKGSVFDAVANLSMMQPKEAAGTILNMKIPFLIAVGALGGVKNKPNVILALIEQMSGNELIANTNSLTRMGVFENPVLKSAYDAGIERAKKDKRTRTLKAGTVKATSKKAGAKLKSLGDEKLEQLGGIEGDWLILGDKSGSMSNAIEIAKEVSALLAQQVKGKVHLIFFHSDPQYFDVTGLDLDAVKQKTRGVRSNGMTSIGCGLDYIFQRGEIVNGIIVVSDGGENTRPYFDDVYHKYSTKFGIEPTVYHIIVQGRAFDTRYSRVEHIVYGRDVDHYSLPNLVKTLRANRYQFLDEIMEIPLLTFKDVFERRANG